MLGGENYVRKFRGELAYIINVAEGLVVAVKVGLLFYGKAACSKLLKHFIVRSKERRK